MTRVTPLPAKSPNLNFHSLEVVGRDHIRLICDQTITYLDL